MKTTTLRRRAIQILAGFLGAVLFMGMVNFIAGVYGYRHLNRTYSLFAVYNSYDKKVDELHDAMVDLFVVDMPEIHSNVLAKADEIKALARQMRELSGHPQFADTYQLSIAYTDLARQWIEGMGRSSDSEAEAMEQFERVYNLVLIQHNTLESHFNSVVDESIVQNSRTWQLQLIITVLLAALLLLYSIGSAMHLGKRVVTPITDLTKSVQHFEQKGEKLPVTIAVSGSYDELHILIRAFEDMTETISAQIEELREKIALIDALRKKEVALSQAELSLMQSLINPHFLYNCLSTLSALATIEKAPRTKKSAIQIASFLRTSLSYLGKEISIQEELDCTKTYVDIQKLRYENRISFDISCDPACAATKIPAILLQPLVENAIQHGVNSYADGARITIRAERQGSEVQMSVTDNGVGIPEDILAEIRNTITSDYSPTHRGFGFRSVSYRLRSLFADTASVVISSKPGHTEVRLLIPAGDDDR